MREMKDSGIEWIGEIPKDWKIIPNKRVMKKSKLICDKYQGQNVISLTMNGVIVRDIENPVGKMPLTFDGYQIVNSGNLLMCLFDIDVTPRCVGVIYDDGVTSPAYSQFILLNGNVPEYFYYYYLNLDYTKELLHLAKNLRHSLTESQLGEIYVPVPPISEQQRIASYLDSKCSKIDDIIEKQQSVIEKLKAYKQSIITEAVTKGLNPDVPMKDSGVEWIGEVPREWKVCKVGYFTKKIGSGKTPKGGAEIYSKKGILFLRSQNIYDTGLKLDDATYISEAIDLEMSATRVLKDDILLNITGGSIGRCCIYPFEETANVNQHVCIIRVNQNIISPQFMHYLWVSNIGKISIDICQTGSNREGMNFNQISKTFFPLPFVDEQKEICDYLDQKCSAIDSTIANKQALIEKLTAYKKSLIYEVVTGKKEV